MTAFEPKSLSSYSQEDVQKILQLAIARQADDQDKEFSYEQLLEIATELEISPDSLNLAERDWRSQQSEIQQRQAFDAYRLSKFKKRFGNYAIFNGFLVLVDFIGGGGLSWSLYILLFWGLQEGLMFGIPFKLRAKSTKLLSRSGIASIKSKKPSTQL
jgi:2TM domain